MTNAVPHVNSVIILLDNHYPPKILVRPIISNFTIFVKWFMLKSYNFIDLNSPLFNVNPDSAFGSP